jgi:rubrerythrin
MKPDPETLIICWTGGVLLALGGVSVAHSFMRRRVEAGVSQDQVFRCGKCASVYTDDPDVERSRCPQCGRTNEAFRF